MSNEQTIEQILDLSDRYCMLINTGLCERWEKWEIEIYDSEVYEAIGGLLARQVTLSSQLAISPSIWNGHVAPLLLRAMIDTHITLAWILLAPHERSQKYIHYGLGQEKLYIEGLKKASDGQDVRLERLIQHREAWLNSQRADFLTEVNIGSWSGSSTRQMAEEANCQSLYRYAYAPFSAAVHSMWQHISRYNLIPCLNPLHKYHRVIGISDIGGDFDYFYRSVKYVDRSFEAFDNKYQLNITTPMPHDWFVKEFDKLSKTPAEDNLEEVDII